MGINHMMGGKEKKNDQVEMQNLQKQDQQNKDQSQNAVVSPLMDPNYQEKRKQTKKTEEALKQRRKMDEEAWKSIREYRKTGADLAAGNYDENWDAYNFEELMDILEVRSNTRSKSFHVMKNALNDLRNLANSGGLKQDPGSNQVPHDPAQFASFQDAFYRAKIATANFVFKHNSIFNTFQAENNTRYQVALRIDRMLNDMQKEVKIAQAALEVKIKEEESAPKTDEETLKILNNMENIKEARQMAIVLHCDKNSEKTLGIPALSHELKSYLENALKEDPLMSGGELADFQAKLDSLTQNYLNENKDRLESINQRKKVMKLALDPEGEMTDGMFELEEVTEMLLEYSEDELNEEFVNLYNAKIQNDNLISSLVKERVSVIFQNEITSKVKSMLGAARIFSSVNDIIDMAGAALDVVLFSNSTAALSEQRRNIMMYQAGIGETYRDAFALYYRNNIHNVNEEKLTDGFKRQVVNNEQLADSILKKKKLTAEGWRNVEKLLRFCGAFPSQEFNQKLNTLLDKNKPKQGERTMLRKEYILGQDTAPTKNYVARSEDRLRGELLLGSAEIKKVLSASQITLLQKNLTSIVLSHLTENEGATTLGVLDKLSPRELKMLANLLKRDILANAEKVNALEGEIKDRMLLKIARGGVGSDEDFNNKLQEETDLLQKESERAKNRLYAHLGDNPGNVFKIKDALKSTKDLSEVEKEKVENYNFNVYGVRNREELFKYLSKVINDKEFKTRSQEVATRFQRQKDLLKTTLNERYSKYVDYLCEIPEVVDAMVDPDEGSFETYCRQTLDVKLKDFVTAFEKTNESELHKKIYLDQNFHDIYVGEKKSDNWEQDISDFCQREFAKQQEFAEDTAWDRVWKWTYKMLGWETKQSREDILDKARDKVKDMIWKTYGRDARFGMLDKAFVYWNNLMNSSKEEDQKAFSSVDELARLGFLGITNHETNQKAALDFITKKVDENTELKALIKADDVKDGKKNLGLFQAQFANYVSKDAIILGAGDFEKNLGKNVDEFLVYYKATLKKMESSVRSEQELKEFNEANEKAIDKIENKKKKGRGVKNEFFGLDVNAINSVIEGKTLVGDSDEMVIRRGRREYEWQRLSDFAERNLPEIVKSCVVERSLSYHLSDGDFARHLSHLDYIYKNISDHIGWDEEKLSDDEKGLLTVFLYKQSDNLEFFKGDELPDLDELVRKPLFKQFRENYKVLRNFEAIETKDPGANQEKHFLSKNLRVLIAHGTGLLDKNGVPFDLALKGLGDMDSACQEYGTLFRDAVQKHMDYLTYKNEAYAFIEEKLKAWKPMSDYAYERYLYALREYYQFDIVKDCHDKKAFSRQDWDKRLSDDFNDEALMRNIRGKDGAREGLPDEFGRDSSLDDGYTMADIEKFIYDKSFMPGMSNKFRRLDHDQKRLFVLALMMMDKSAIGRGIKGSNEVLNSPDGQKDKKIAANKALAEYLQGKEMSITLDYQDALSKLMNLGEYYTFSGSETISETAYNDAMQFAMDMKLQKTYNSDRDLQRVGDGNTSVMEAARLFGKPQFEIVKKLGSRINTIADVKNELFDMAVKENASEIAGRIGNMNERDLRLFIKILQNRTLLDNTTMKTPNGERICVDEEARQDLIDALVGEETRAAVLSDVTEPDSCLKALTTAYSFQIRDDITRKDTHLTKEHFDQKSISRTTLIDWKLINKAYNLMVEIKQKQVQAHMLRHASEHIEESGNQEAIKEYKKLKKQQGEKKDTTLKQFEDYILKNAQSDEIKRVVAGYMSFTDAQKRLFIKALGRRDILDISKKNYYSNFFTGAERDYVNKADRYALIDEFITGSKLGGSGVALEKGAHYDALCSLFSTQMSDTEGIKAYGGAQDKMSGEKMIYMQRSTAIDWKLFTRAVSFVNRASKELEYAEGNQELYRSAGNITENGELQMDYSLLRKNYHQTGSGTLRFISRNVFGRVISTYSLSTAVGGAFMGAEWVDKTLLDDMFESELKKASPLKDIKKVKNLKAEKIGKVKLSKTKKKVKEPAYNFDVLKKNIDKIIDGKKSLEEVMSAVADNIKIYGYFPKDGKSMKVKKGKDFLDLSKAPEGISKTDYTYGDIRDYKYIAVRDFKYIADYTGMVAGFMYNYAYSQMMAVYGAGILKDKLVESYLSKGDFAYAQLLTEKILKERFDKALVDKIGKEETRKLLKDTKNLKENAESMSEVLSTAMKGYYYANKCLGNVNSIIEAAGKYSSLNAAEKFAGDKLTTDENRLKNAGKYQTDAQKELTKKTVESQEKLMKLGVDLSKIDQAEKISASMLNIIVDTVSLNKIVVSGGEKVISETINGAVQLCLYMTTLALDKGRLADYYRNSQDGKQTVQRLLTGLKAVYASDPQKYDALEKSYNDGTMSDSTLLTIVRDGLGYQNDDELISDTCMKVAQNVVFCASKYNPMESNKVMAKAVMAAMGLSDSIGDTSPATAEKLYKKMNKVE